MHSARLISLSKYCYELNKALNDKSVVEKMFSENKMSKDLYTGRQVARTLLSLAQNV